MVAYTLNASTWEAEADLCEFEARLTYLKEKNNDNQKKPNKIRAQPRQCTLSYTYHIVCISLFTVLFI